MCNQILVAHLCQAMLCFGPQLGEVWLGFAKSKAQLMVFLTMPPYQIGDLNHCLDVTSI
jgi:hypothetical protein